MKKNIDKAEKGFIYTFAGCAVFLLAILLAQMICESLPALKNIGISMFRKETRWLPVAENPQFGLMPVIVGTLYVSFISVLLALIGGIATALYLNFYVQRKVSGLILSFIDTVAGVPSVIFGFVGLSVLVKYFSENFQMAAGQSVLAASIILAIMLLPFIVSTLYESISRAREKYELNVLALGISKEIFILKIIFPAIKNSLAVAVVMAFGRGLGETMAVMMVIGNSPIYPKLMGRAQTIPALTALEMGSVEYGSLHMSVLYVANLILLVILFTVTGLGYYLKRKTGYNEK